MQTYILFSLLSEFDAFQRGLVLYGLAKAMYECVLEGSWRALGWLLGGSWIALGGLLDGSWMGGIGHTLGDGSDTLQWGATP